MTASVTCALASWDIDVFDEDIDVPNGATEEARAILYARHIEETYFKVTDMWSFIISIGTNKYSVDCSDGSVEKLS